MQPEPRRPERRWMGRTDGHPNIHRFDDDCIGGDVPVLEIAFPLIVNNSLQNLAVIQQETLDQKGVSNQ